MKYDNQFLLRVMKLGALGYDTEKCLNVLEPETPEELGSWNRERVRKDLTTTGSILQRQYQKGVDKASYQIDAKLFKLASEGDMKAIQKLEERQAYH